MVTRGGGSGVEISTRQASAHERERRTSDRGQPGRERPRTLSGSDGHAAPYDAALSATQSPGGALGTPMRRADRQARTSSSESARGSAQDTAARVVETGRRFSGVPPDAEAAMTSPRHRQHPQHIARDGSPVQRAMGTRRDGDHDPTDAPPSCPSEPFSHTAWSPGAQQLVPGRLGRRSRRLAVLTADVGDAARHGVVT